MSSTSTSSTPKRASRCAEPVKMEGMCAAAPPFFTPLCPASIAADVPDGFDDRAAILAGHLPLKGGDHAGRLTDTPSAALAIGESLDDGQSPPLRGRCPAGQRGVQKSAA